MKIALLAAALCAAPALAQSPLQFAVTFPASRSQQPIDGRLLVYISTDTSGEPRTQVSDAPGTQQVFGIDVDGWKPGETRTIDATAFGYPLPTLAQLRRGSYRVQALVNRYETFRRSDGHTVKLPPDKWEGQQMNSKPGNLYSTAKPVTHDGRRTVVQLSLDNEIPAITEADFRKLETKYV